MNNPHSNTIQRPNSQELRQSPREPGRQLQDDEKNQSGDHHPFASVAVGYGAEDERADGPQHECDGDALRIGVSQWVAFRLAIPRKYEL
jgi:hypothetical protein